MKTRTVISLSDAASTLGIPEPFIASAYGQVPSKPPFPFVHSRTGVPLSTLRNGAAMLELANHLRRYGFEFPATDYGAWLRLIKFDSIYTGNAFDGIAADDVVTDEEFFERTGMRLTRPVGRVAPKRYLSTETRYFVASAAVESALKPDSTFARWCIKRGVRLVKVNDRNAKLAAQVNKEIRARRQPVT